MGSNKKLASSAVSLPKAGGSLAGLGETFTPDPFRGTGNFAIPIPLSPGRDGFGPRLSLEYSTGNGNGPFGLGWRLALPDISRQTRHGLPRYSDRDTFVFAGADDLVLDTAVPPRTEGGYSVRSFRPRREGLFARIEHWQVVQREAPSDGLSRSFWKVTTGENQTSIFGATTNAVLADPENPERIFRWCLELTYDGKGNYIRYVYKPEDGRNVSDAVRRGVNTYIKQISYGNFESVNFRELEHRFHELTDSESTSQCAFHVLFDYGEHVSRDDGAQLVADNIYSVAREWDTRSDAFSNCQPGFEVRTYRCCKRILVFHHFPRRHEENGGKPSVDSASSRPVLVRSTDFQYVSFPYNGVTGLASVTQRGYRQTDEGSLRQSGGSAPPDQGVQRYVIASMPPIEFEYSTFQPVTSASLAKDLVRLQTDRLDHSAPSGTATRRDRPALHERDYALIDLFGAGRPDFLETRVDGYSYWRNLGGGRFSGVKARLQDAPNRIVLSDERVGLADITGDGYPDLLDLRPPQWGYYPGTPGRGWGSFEAFEGTKPPFSLNDGNLRLVDLTGDGRLDALHADSANRYYFRCLSSESLDDPCPGFGEPETLSHFPDVSFSDPRVHLADLTGDGLEDIVLIQSGEMHYWPNLGFGDFGQQVSLNVPGLGPFDPERMFFVDIDGSGPADLVHVEGNGIRFWLNQSGNGWSEPYEVRGTPSALTIESVKVTDLLGKGIAGILWSRPEGIDHYQYLPLARTGKPGLLTRISNNMGLTTRFSYRPSTEFAAADGDGTEPAPVRLPFPVYVLSQVETLDDVMGSKLTTEYRYAHGCYDEEEREFVGFGRVDQWDTETVVGVGEDWQDREGLRQPPVETRTWYHTGAHHGPGVSRQFAGEYYAGDQMAHLLPDTVLPDDLSKREQRDAQRALRGNVLRQETYGRDDSQRSNQPYSVSEYSYQVRRIQPAKPGDDHRSGAPAVFSVQAGEVLTYRYERNPEDPRVTHRFALAFDAFDHETLVAEVAYARRAGRAVEPEQQETLVTVTERQYGQRIDSNYGYRHGVPVDERTFQLTGIATPDGELVQADHLRRAIRDAAEIAYERLHTAGAIQRRPIAGTRYTYWDDDGTRALALGEVGLLALPHNVYEAAFTPGLVATVFGDRVSPDVLANEGGYVFEDGYWWAPSGHPKMGWQAFDPQRFHLPVRVIDPFGNATAITYDSYALLVEQTTDPVGNVIRAQNDYRVLQPWAVIDPNGNRSEVRFDALGMVVGTAVMGKGTGPVEGDSFATFTADLTSVQTRDFFGAPDPRALAAEYLGTATTRVIYDLRQLPVGAATISRETHVTDLAPEQHSRSRLSFSYFDGFGRELQQKLQAEPGPVPRRDASGRIILGADDQPELTTDEISPRWVGSGWTVFNNKGKPVRQYEPFFTHTHQFERDVRIGVSSVLLYDPADRVVATLHPNHAWEKLVFDTWRQESWDASDTVLTADPGTDPDVGTLFRRLPVADYLPTWYALRTDPGRPTEASHRSPDPKRSIAEKDAAEKAAVHGGTPTVTHVDPLGRAFLSVAHNRYRRADTPLTDPPIEEFYCTRVVFDIAGNQREVIDASDRCVIRYEYDMLGNRIHQVNMDTGQRWVLNDAVGKPIRAWDSRGHSFRTEYDQLQRPTDSFLREGTGKELLVGRTVYGEGWSKPEARNFLGKVVQVADQAGVVTSDVYDFKGNLLRSQRQLAQEYKTILDWSAEVPLETPCYTNHTRYDALNRPVELTAPDGSIVRPIYNDGNLLEGIDVNLRGERQNGEPIWTPFVTDIDYDAKGQRKLIDYGNGVRTVYEYDPLTFRLLRLLTRRSAPAFADDCPQPPPSGWPGCHVQNLNYTYDPVGNITHISDDAQQTIYLRNKRVEPSGAYTYDALYRLIEATGREHLGQAGGTPIPSSYNDTPHVELLHPGDGNAMGTYIESYAYDAVGNLLKMHHRGSDPSRPGWTRSYHYDEASPIEPGKQCNRLTSTAIGETTETYSHDGNGYDAHGNMLRMPHLPVMRWDYRDQLQSTVQKAPNNGATETTFYVYDAGGQRVRKVTELTVGEVKDERIYLGDFEIHRRQASDPLVRETLHIMDDQRCIALVETRATGTEAAVDRLIRYQLENHLGSACLELDDRAQILSYEEYFPYGSTSYSAMHSQSETSKRYRYVRKERDEESGLYYYGARYYACWLGRWTSADPASGMPDGTDPYIYVRSNPIRLVDPVGMQAAPWWKRGVLAMGGAVKSVANIPVEAGKQIYDFGGLATESLGIATGWPNYQHRLRSGIGVMAETGMGSGDIFRTVGKNILQTPTRAWAAAEREDWAGFGSEAMNLYMIGRSATSLAIGAGKLAFNEGVGLLRRFGSAGAGVQYAIRTWQVGRLAGQAEKVLGINRPPRVVYDPNLSTFGLFDPASGTLSMGESAFRLSFSGMVPGGLGGSTLSVFRLRVGNLLRGNLALRTMTHEMHHFGQSAAFPSLWNTSFPRLGDPFEFTLPNQPSGLVGAWNIEMTVPAGPIPTGIGMSSAAPNVLQPQKSSVPSARTPWAKQPEIMIHRKFEP